MDNEENTVSEVILCGIIPELPSSESILLSPGSVPEPGINHWKMPYP